jgi:hypothetical protein
MSRLAAGSPRPGPTGRSSAFSLYLRRAILGIVAGALVGTIVVLALWLGRGDEARPAAAGEKRPNPRGPLPDSGMFGEAPPTMYLPSAHEVRVVDPDHGKELYRFQIPSAESLDPASGVAVSSLAKGDGPYAFRVVEALKDEDKARALGAILEVLRPILILKLGPGQKYRFTREHPTIHHPADPQPGDRGTLRIEPTLERDMLVAGPEYFRDCLDRTRRASRSIGDACARSGLLAESYEIAVQAGIEVADAERTEVLGALSACSARQTGPGPALLTYLKESFRWPAVFGALGGLFSTIATAVAEPMFRKLGEDAAAHWEHAEEGGTTEHPGATPGSPS